MKSQSKKLMKPLARRQRGVTSVEIAIVGLVFLVILFGVIEVGRLFWVLNSLDEATRRGARMAAVCQINDPAIQEVAIFNASGDASNSLLVPGLTTGNIEVNYLDTGGNIIGNPGPPPGNFDDIRYVQVGVVNFQHTLIIPTFFTTFTLPEFRTTLPRESLGVSRDGFTPC